MSKTRRPRLPDFGTEVAPIRPYTTGMYASVYGTWGWYDDDMKRITPQPARPLHPATDDFPPHEGWVYQDGAWTDATMELPS